HAIDNDYLLAYTKTSPDFREVLLVVVNLDPYHTQSGWVELPTELLRVAEEHPFQVHDLLTGEWFLWQGQRNFVMLDPRQSAAHIFHLHRQVHTQRDFPNYA